MYTKKGLKAQIMNAAQMIDASEKAGDRKTNVASWKLYRALIKMEETGNYDDIHEN